MKYLLILLLCPSVFAKTYQMKDFAYGREIYVSQSDKSTAVFKLDDEMASKIKSDLKDMRVFNAEGEELPHQFHLDKKIAHIERRPNVKIPFFPIYMEYDEMQPLKGYQDIQKQIKVSDGGTLIEIKGAAQVDQAKAKLFYLVDFSSIEDSPDKLQFSFRGKPTYIFKLKGTISDDLNNWQGMNSQNTMAKLNHEGAQIIKNEMLAPRSKYLLLSVGEEGIELDSVEGMYEPSKVSDYDYSRMERKDARLMIEGTDKNKFKYDLGYPALVREIKPKTGLKNSMGKFSIEYSLDGKRWDYFNSTDVYFLNNNNASVENSSLEMGRNLMARYWRLSLVSSQASFGTHAPALEIAYHPIKIKFLLRGASPYTLAYGSNLVTSFASYIQSPVELGGSAEASLGEESELGGTEVLNAKPKDEDASRRYILWGILIFGVIFMGYMAKTLIKEGNSSQ